MNPIIDRVRERAKAAAFRYTRLGAPVYPYNVEPMELATLISELERVKEIEGSILEIGVARGMTTRFLCEHLLRNDRLSEKYYALDTFESFTPDDVDFEVTQRGKTREEMVGFAYNDFEKWKQNFRDFKFLTAYKTDCSVFDYSRVAPIKLAFLDVDLYLPTKKTLPVIYENLCEGGVLLIDDVVRPPARWDGAYQAYSEFCTETGMQFTLVGNKMGVLRK